MALVHMPWLVLLITVYVTLDVANPLMPGALTFGIEESVEVRTAERFRGHDDPVLARAMLPSELMAPTTRQTTMSRAPAADVVRIWPPHPQRARSSLATPASPSEDH